MHIDPTEEYLASQGLSKTFPDRFWAKVKKSDGCWEWTAARNAYGYGVIGRGRSGSGNILASRAVWILERGPIPDGLFMLHKCDNPPCVRPDHLFLGTQLDNLRDAKEKGRVAAGERIGVSRLTESLVREMRNMRLSGASFKHISKALSLGYSITRDAITGKTWHHIH